MMAFRRTGFEPATGCALSQGGALRGAGRTGDMIREPGWWRAVRHAVRRLCAWQACVLCAGHSHSRLICAHCRRALPRLPADQLAAAGLGLDRLAVRWIWQGPVATLVTRYKYSGLLALAPELAALLPPPPAGCRHLLPVPASRHRLCERGFDPAWLLARAYAARHALQLLEARRLRETPRQASLDRTQRLRSLQGVFACPPMPSTVLLIDDVLTTGGTLRALAQASRAAGAREVGAVVLARTLDSGSGLLVDLPQRV